LYVKFLLCKKEPSGTDQPKSTESDWFRILDFSSRGEFFSTLLLEGIFPFQLSELRIKLFHFINFFTNFQEAFMKLVSLGNSLWSQFTFSTCSPRVYHVVTWPACDIAETGLPLRSPELTASDEGRLYQLN